jgi:drug/metabolite transporter (DMT)-like permease
LLTIYAASFAIKAGINFGVIASCISLSTPFNCLFSYLFYGEKLTSKMMIGTAVLFGGVVVVSLGKLSDDPNHVSIDDQNEIFRISAIGIGIVVAFLNAVRTAHAKYMFLKF